MKSILRVGARLRQVVASTSSLNPICATNFSSSSSSRQIHGSPPLDPSDHMAAAESSLLPPYHQQSQHNNDGTLSATALAQAFADGQASSASSATADVNSRVYVKLRHLHPTTRQTVHQLVPLSAHVFGSTPRRDVLHSAIVYHLDSLRTGTASSKTRGEVNYSGRKLRPQKGTGNARLGSRGNPLLRGGGVAHGPKPRDFATELPRRVRELALRSALGARWKEGKLHIVPSLYWDPPPRVAGPLRRALGSRGWEDSLFLTAPRSPLRAPKMGIRQRAGRPSALDPIYTPEQIDLHSLDVQNFAIALANLPRTEMIRLDLLAEEAKVDAKSPQEKKKPGELPAYEIIKRQNLILDLGAVEWLEEKLGGSIFHATDGEGGEGEGEDLMMARHTEQEQEDHPSLAELERLANEDGVLEGVSGMVEEELRASPATTMQDEKR